MRSSCDARCGRLQRLTDGRPRDVIRIEGVPPILMEIDGGIHGDVATWSIVVNAIPRVLAAPRGLRLPLDLAVPASASAKELP